MSENNEHHDGHGHDDGHYVNYKKIYFILLGLFVISVVGPELGIRWVTLITAFGIAVWKAYLVAKNFMHLNVQPRFVIYMLVTTLVFMLLFYAGTAGDVMKQSGQNWYKPYVEEAAPAAH